MFRKCCTQYASKFGKLSMATGWGMSIFIPITKKFNAKECSNYCILAALISHASKIMFNILQARLQQYMNWELPDGQAGFRKGRGTRDQIANNHLIIEKAREFQNIIYLCFIDYTKTIDWVTTINCGKFWKRWGTRPPDLSPEISVCRSKRSN